MSGLVHSWLRLARTPRQRQRHRAVDLIRRSFLFDRDWYLSTYPDVERAGIDPLIHYLECGWAEGRDPGPRFSTSAYLRANADVSAAGVNPLLHYVEHGHSEGRGAPEHGAPAPSGVRPRKAFGPAAPVVSFPLEEEPAVRWRRSGGDSTSHEDGSVHVDNYFICRPADVVARSGWEEALSTLAFLSGGCDPPAQRSRGPATAPELVDAWFPASNRLRTRWRTDDGRPIVGRALQHVEGSPTLAGEALLTTDLDIFDSVLTNRLFPVLFIFTSEAGELVGSRLVAFPSMFRGGLHYPESLALASAQAIQQRPDLTRIIECLCDDLLAIRSGNRAAAIQSIEVDLAGADGASAIFQKDVQFWLERVVRIGVAGRCSKTGSASDYLTAAVRVAGDGSRPKNGAVLRIGPDMAPSISALVACSDDSSEERASVVAASSDPAVPAVNLSLRKGLQTGGLFPNFPSADGGQVNCLLAVRRIGDGLADAQMLVPIAAPALQPGGSDEPVTWAVSVSGVREQNLRECLESLGAQAGSGSIEIAFAGRPSASAEAFARWLFNGRVHVADDLQDAIRSARTPLVGHIAGNVVLHDCRTTAFLREILKGEGVATASLMLVSVVNRSRETVVQPIDAGEIRLHSGMTGQHMGQVAKALWRSCWPVASPPKELWLMRRGDAGQVHLCSYHLSASRTGAPTQAAYDFSLRYSQAPALECEILHG